MRACWLTPSGACSQHVKRSRVPRRSSRTRVRDTLRLVQTAGVPRVFVENDLVVPQVASCHHCTVPATLESGRATRAVSIATPRSHGWPKRKKLSSRKSTTFSSVKRAIRAGTPRVHNPHGRSRSQDNARRDRRSVRLCRRRPISSIGRIACVISIPWNGLFREWRWTSSTTGNEILETRWHTGSWVSGHQDRMDSGALSPTGV